MVPPLRPGIKTRPNKSTALSTVLSGLRMVRMVGMSLVTQPASTPKFRRASCPGDMPPSVTGRFLLPLCAYEIARAANQECDERRRIVPTQHDH